MQFTLVTLLSAAAGIASALPSGLEARQTAPTASVKWDPIYDNGAQSMLTVACSDGANGLAHKYPTFGAAPAFNAANSGVGATPYIAGWNSGACGKCYSLTYEATGTTVTVLGVDAGGVSTNSFNIGKGLMDKLTGGRAEEFGTVQVKVADAACP